ncbi:MAG: PepSY domain-containing protein [Gammaproteobacteria bacterium]|nr:PepSY domain-containing protein [Gammaproteobacteria bacterium]
MNKITTPLSLAAIIAAGALALSTVAAKTLDGHQYLKSAKISLASARATALKTYPGKIVSEELEREHGGSGLRYSFDVRNGSATHEVGVDAKTGAVLENSVEGPDSD